MFQSPPGTMAGCYVVAHVSNKLQHSVSIPTRHDGRVLQEHHLQMCLLQRSFQSPPGTMAGCYELTGPLSGKDLGVSIPTRHDGRVLRCVSPPSVCARSPTFQSPPGTMAGCYA